MCLAQGAGGGVCVRGDYYVLTCVAVLLLSMHGPVFSANFRASGGGVFGKTIFGYHDKLLTNVLDQR